MDLFASLTNLINSQSSSLVAGVIAALTPCALAMIPVALYSFGLRKQNRKSLITALIIFSVSFVLTFSFIGLVLQSVLSGSLVNIVRIILGFSLVLAAFLVMTGANLTGWTSKLTSPLALGVIMPLAISLSPCVLPWLALSSNGNNQLLSMLSFGVGLVIPSVAIALLGNAGYQLTKKIKAVTHYLDMISPLLLLLAGVYMLMQLMLPTSNDLILSTSFIFGVYILISYKVFAVKSLRTLYNFGWSVICLLAVIAVPVVAMPIVSKNAGLSLHEVKILCNTVIDPQIASSNSQISFMIILAAILLGFWWYTKQRKSTKLAWEA